MFPSVSLNFNVREEIRGQRMLSGYDVRLLNQRS